MSLSGVNVSPNYVKLYFCFSTVIYKTPHQTGNKTLRRLVLVCLQPVIKYFQSVWKVTHCPTRGFKMFVFHSFAQRALKMDKLIRVSNFLRGKELMLSNGNYLDFIASGKGFLFKFRNFL